MIETIILLTGAVEQTALAALLRQHNPRLMIHTAATLADLEAIEPPALRRARLIGFVTPVIVPAHILERLGCGAYNFHPGPSHYPGWAPSHFAIYDRATEFGATAHVMAEQVDTGPIVGVDSFRIPPNANVVSLETMTYVRLARLFWSLANTLATQTEPLPELPIGWRGRKNTRRQFAAMCEISADIAREELDRRIAAFGGGQGGLAPTVSIHGHDFRYAGAAPESKRDNVAVAAVGASTAPAVASIA